MWHSKKRGSVLINMQNAGVWSGIIILIYASVMFFQAYSLKYYTQTGPGPGLFPLWLSGLLIIVTLIYIWQSLKKEVVSFKDIFPKGKALGNVVSVWVASFLFMLMLNYTGFIFASSFLLFTLFIRGYKWQWALGLAIGTSIFLFLAFDKVFGIPLPVSIFGW